MSRLTTELFIEPRIVRENIIQLKNKIDASSKFMAIIKSDAYGHILPMIVKDIDDLVDGYGVVRLEEAMELRKISNKKILLMQGVYSREDLKESIANALDLVIHNSHQFEIITGTVAMDDYYAELIYSTQYTEYHGTQYAVIATGDFNGNY